MTDSAPGARWRSTRRTASLTRSSRGRTTLAVLAVVLLLTLGAPGTGLEAQTTADPPSRFRAWPMAEAAWQLSSVAGGGRSLFGGTLGFGVTPRTMIGGGGFRLSGTAPLPGAGTIPGRRLAFGYAGMVVEHVLATTASWAGAATALVGAGHADVRSGDTGIELGADNFGVVEVGVVGVWRGAAPVHLLLGGGYRFVGGVQDLPGASGSDLRGPGLTLTLRLVGR